MRDNSPSVADAATLSAAINESEMLLAHAALNGIKVDDDTLTTLIRSKSLVQLNSGDEATYDAQIAFWKARSVLSQSLMPLSASSLIFTTQRVNDPSLYARMHAKITRTPPPKTTAAAMAVKKMQKIIALALFGLLVMQAYFIIGSTVVTEVTPIIKEFKQNVDDRSKVMDRADSAEKSSEIRRLENDAGARQVDMEIRVKLLQRWNSGWNWSTLLRHGRAPTSDGTYQTLLDEQLAARFALETLSKFILPLMYGLLGAALFVLRSLSQDVKTYTFSSDRLTLYRMRLYIGTLLGFVASWFLPHSEDMSAFKNLGPYIVSLLAGYSVDIVFSLMDKLLSTFSNITETPKSS